MADKKADVRVGTKVVQKAGRTVVQLVVSKAETTVALTAVYWVVLRVAR